MGGLVGLVLWACPIHFCIYGYALHKLSSVFLCQLFLDIWNLAKSKFGFIYLFFFLLLCRNFSFLQIFFYSNLGVLCSNSYFSLSLLNTEVWTPLERPRDNILIPCKSSLVGISSFCKCFSEKAFFPVYQQLFEFWLPEQLPSLEF